MTKAEMIASMLTAGISQKYLNELNGMTDKQVAKEFDKFGRLMLH